MDSTSNKSQDGQVDKGACAPPCVILAGGQAVRLGGGDKCLLPLAGKPLVQHIMNGLQDHVLGFALNANGDANRFSSLGVPVIPDREADCGPLAGICAALEWAAHTDPNGEWVLIISGDTPFIPGTLAQLMLDRVREHHPSPDIVMPQAGQRTHPLCALWRLDQLADLSTAVYDGGLRSVQEWCGRVATAKVYLDDLDPGHWFFNINTHADLARAEKYLKDLSK